ncbi:T9SS type A sorting domain-containing protein [Xylanibacter caecicola]|uniref:T9SS type A sorting domain-containing protein n=1 Tax=Xylanibacter caecicola TaxID=2736294 RepID=UPI0025880DA4|nr:T9SS type A sorting domain-containing protein [Xylanibacter caecicola]
MLQLNISKTIVVTVLFSVTLSLSAQNNIRYSYDAAGNRIKREIVIEPQKVPENSQKAPKGRNGNDFGGKYTADIRTDNNGSRIVTSIKGLTAADKCHIEIYSAHGALMMRCDMNGGSAVTEMSGMQDGVYLMRITVNGMSNTWKITKK